MNTNKLIDKVKTDKGDEIIVVRRTRDTNYWYCGYVKCTTKITIDPEFPRQGITEDGHEVMLFNQPELGLEGWFYFWDTAHLWIDDTVESLLCEVIFDLYDSDIKEVNKMLGRYKETKNED